jgi:hypothetical protein
MFASSVCFGGSRSLAAAWSPLVRRVVGACVAAGVPAFAVGCAVGGDALALSALVSSGAAARVSVFCVGEAVVASSGAVSASGFWSGSAVAGVVSAVAAGAAPVWWAGGGPAVPLQERLAVRSRVCCAPGGSPVAVGCWFLASPLSVGSLGAARALAAAGGSVVVFCCGWESSLLPALLPGGGWVAVLGGPFAGGFVWAPVGAVPPSWASPGGAARGGLSRRAFAAACGAPGARPPVFSCGALGPLGFGG